MKLTELAAKYGTDKANYHHYTEIYEELLAGRTIRKMLEIGIGCPEEMGHWPGYKTGASLYMWQEYFPEAEIYALDNRRDILINEGRIKSFYCDQSSLSSLKMTTEIIGRDFDFIVDDGTHVPADQALTARMLRPLLLPGGLYVIEDVLDPQAVKDFLADWEITERRGTPTDDRLLILCAGK